MPMAAKKHMVAFDCGNSSYRVVLGTYDGEKITMEELGDLSGRFNYELACDLGKRIPRVYEKGGKILSTKDYYEDF